MKSHEKRIHRPVIRHGLGLVQDATWRLVARGQSDRTEINFIGHGPHEDGTSWSADWNSNGTSSVGSRDGGGFEIVYDPWEVMDHLADYLGIKQEDRTWSKQIERPDLG